MDYQDAVRRIDEECKIRGRTVVNRNAFHALLGAFGHAGEALGTVLFGRQDALDADKARIQMDLVIKLLCAIDEAISSIEVQAKSAGVDWTIFAGKVTARGTGVDQVTGVYVPSDSGPVEFKPGSEVLAEGENAGSVTGVNLGGPPPKGKKK